MVRAREELRTQLEAAATAEWLEVGREEVAMQARRRQGPRPPAPCLSRSISHPILPLSLFASLPRSLAPMPACLPAFPNFFSLMYRTWLLPCRRLAWRSHWRLSSALPPPTLLRSRTELHKRSRGNDARVRACATPRQRHVGLCCPWHRGAAGLCRFPRFESIASSMAFPPVRRLPRSALMSPVATQAGAASERDAAARRAAADAAAQRERDAAAERQLQACWATR